jgi:hypothetical protein
VTPPDPAWLAWLRDHIWLITVITGITALVGMFTGIAALLVSLRANRRTTANARADVELRVRVEHDRAQLEAGKLKAPIIELLSRRKGVLSLNGGGRRDLMEVYKKQADDDTAEADRLVSELAAIDAAKLESRNVEQLHDSLASIRQAQTRITSLADKCHTAIDACEQERVRLVEAQRQERASRIDRDRR